MFSVFLLISVCIWFLNALSKNYTSVIEYTLTYTDFPAGQVLVGDSSEDLDLRVNANGYSILRYKTFRKRGPISYNVANNTLSRPEEDTTRAFILTRYITGQISQQLPPDLQLLEIKPDTLHFQFARKITRMVEILPDFKYQLDKQFTIKDRIILEPDSVEVTGPDLLLDTLRYVYTESSDLGDLSKDFSDKVRLRRISDLDFNRSRTNCLIELERFTEVQLSIPIEVLNLPDSIALQTFPSRVKLTCNVGLSKYDRVDGSLIKAVVDYSEITDGTKLLDVDIQSIPVFLISSEYYPKSVEYLKSRR